MFHYKILSSVSSKAVEIQEFLKDAPFSSLEETNLILTAADRW